MVRRIIYVKLLMNKVGLSSEQPDLKMVNFYLPRNMESDITGRRLGGGQEYIRVLGNPFFIKFFNFFNNFYDENYIGENALTIPSFLNSYLPTPPPQSY